MAWQVTLTSYYQKRESQNKLISFKKLSPIEEDRMILSFLSTSQAVGEAIAGKRLLNKEDVLPVGRISDTIRDDEMVDIHRVQKYFDRNAWFLVLKSSREKNSIDFVCSVCTKVINDECEDSIACDRCLLWSHFKCTSLKKRPKNRNWFCTSCRVKYAWLFTWENESREPTARDSPVSMIIISGFKLNLAP